MDIDESLSRIAALIEPYSLVLDVGCSSGMLGRFLTQKSGCIIDGIDIDENAIANCHPTYRKVAVRNLETDLLTDTFKEESYDYIVVADVIEHLVDAKRLLNQIRLLIKPTGTIYLSIPNVAHVSLALHLLFGKFSYTPSGLLDSTHLRFFTRESFAKKIEECGVYCWDIQSVHRGIDETEFGDDLEYILPQPWLRQLIETRPDALTYQWIFTAKLYPPKPGDQPTPNGTEPTRPIPLLNACLYWDMGTGFAEEHKLMGVTRPRPPDGKILEFLLSELPNAPLRQLRIDPCSSPQWMKLRSAQLSDDAGTVVWRWKPGVNDGTAGNAYWLVAQEQSERIVVSDHVDGHWIPDIPSEIMCNVANDWKFSMEVVSQSQMASAEIVMLLAQKDRALTEKDQRLLSEIASLEQTKALLASSELTLQRITGSRLWRITSPLRLLVRRTRTAMGRTRHFIARGIRFVARVRQTGISNAISPLFSEQFSATTYSEWIAKHDSQKALSHPAGQLTLQPLISVIMPTYNTSPEMLDMAISSVRQQSYANWELCIADDASTLPETQAVIHQHVAGDGRIHAIFREMNGHISEASNSALSISQGDYITFLDHDDQLAPDALMHVVCEINAHPTVDVIYTDEDKISEDGVRSAPFFKPDWSPHLALSQAYLGHLVCYRAALVKRLGGLRSGLDGAQDYDLWLRAANITSEIRHLPQVLYHWRMHPGSTAADGTTKPYAHDAGRRAVNDFLRQRYPSAAVEGADGEHLFTYQAKFSLPDSLLVSIIIPTKDKSELLAECINSIVTKSSWKNFEIILLDNNSSEAKTFDYFDFVQKEDSRIKVISMPIPFNWSRLNNLGVKQAKGGVLVFLNNDTSVISADWIEYLAGYSQLPDVGTVGGLLLFDDGTIQHSGVVVGMNNWADHVFKGTKPLHAGGPFVSPVLTRNVLAVTGACLAIAREKFETLGGFDEAFVICGSDVELGLRAHRQGLFNVMCAEARLYHHESKTRNPAAIPENDFIQSDKKYSPYRLTVADPFYSPNLSIDNTTPTLS